MNKKKVVIFFDTNRVFSLFRRFVSNNGVLPSSELRVFAFSDEYTFILSTFVFIEMRRISAHYNIEHFGLRFVRFLGYMNFTSIQSIPYTREIVPYVKDIYDAQILQDAVDVKADILLTNNLKDFYIDKISKDFHIIVTNRL